MKSSLVATSTIEKFALLILLGPTGQVKADGPEPPTATPAVPDPAMPADLARQIQEVTDAVLEHHVEPPARQQMILAGIRALDRLAGAPDRPGLARRVSAITTTEPLADLLKEAWPKTTARPITAKQLEDVLLEGLLAPLPGGARLMTAKERNAAEQLAANRYVGILVFLGRDEKEQRPTFPQVREGGPAARAGVRAGDILEAIDGIDTRGMDLREVMERVRGDEGTDVTIKVRSPNEAKSRTLTITRGRMPSDRPMQPTVEGVSKLASRDGKTSLDEPGPIGYLKIAAIGVSTSHEIRKLASRMEHDGARALVIDLRGAGFGVVSEEVNEATMHAAVLVADGLLERETIGRVRTARGATAYQADSDALFRGWPMAVLVNSTTSGAAEWLAAALQDNHRAVIVGSPTRSAHQLVDLPPGAPRIEEDPGVRSRTEEAIASDTAVRSAVAAGDGRRWVTLMTGYLERGDGRPLADGPSVRIGNSADVDQRSGVRPDHALGPMYERSGRLQSFRGPAGSPDTSTDPVLHLAVKVLQEALAKP